MGAGRRSRPVWAGAGRHSLITTPHLLHTCYHYTNTTCPLHTDRYSLLHVQSTGSNIFVAICHGRECVEILKQANQQDLLDRRLAAA